MAAFVTPADSMAAAYDGMVSLWNVTTAAVTSIAPASLIPDIDSKAPATAQDAHIASWDGTSAILPNSSPSESRLYLQAQLRTPILPLDLYYLLYLLERFEHVGIELEGWEGTTAREVGDSTPRVAPPSSTAGAVGDGRTPTRPPSIRSFASTAVSTLTLITGWKQWSTAASLNPSNLVIEDEVHFIRKVFKHIPSLRLVSKIPPGGHSQGKGRIEDYYADGIITVLNHGRRPEQEGETLSKSPLLLLPLAATFPVLTHLELHMIPPDSVDGWETLMKHLKSLVIIQSGIEDIYDVIVTAVVQSEKRRRQRRLLERTRAVQIKEEQEEAQKDAALTSQGLDDATTAGNANGIQLDQAQDDDDVTILASLKMWPVLHHLSMSDNSFPGLAHSNTFMNAQSIVSLDLSHNLFISPPSGLIHLHNLNELNLSYNMIAGVQTIYQTLGNVSVLDLRGNRLESLAGLERLWNLEKVDVRENFLSEAAEVGRLAALPGIKEVWSERNPFCSIQPKYRLEILAVFKANGHDVSLDGSFASIADKIALASMSPTSFSTSISGVNNVANIPASSVPVATFAETHSRSSSTVEDPLSAANKASTGSGPTKPANKLVKKRLVKSNKRVKRVVNLDSDHEEEPEASTPPDEDMKEADELQDNEVASIMTRASEKAQSSVTDGAVKKKKKKKTSGKPPSTSAHGETLTSVNENGQAEEPVKVKKTKRRLTGKKEEGHPADGNHDPSDDHSLCRDGHHVHKHRLAHLERAMTSLQLEKNGVPGHQRYPSRGIKKAPTMPVAGSMSPPNRPSSPIGSLSSDEAGTGGYKRKIEAMRSEAGNNWLMVLAEMDGDSSPRGTSGF